MDGCDCVGIFPWISRLFPDDRHLSSILTLKVPPRLCHCRDIADRDSQRRGFFVFENPDFPIHDSSGSPATMHNGWSRSREIAYATCTSRTIRDSWMVQIRSYREITNRDFLMQRFYTPKISDGKIPTPPQNADTCPAEING
jgi:hypothetical protein